MAHATHHENEDSALDYPKVAMTTWFGLKLPDQTTGFVLFGAWAGSTSKPHTARDRLSEKAADNQHVKDKDKVSTDSQACE
ncbi:hypothetical protein E4U30_000159 [Claviceps sp. LM220 group G6]|nr:hypothetical protein E4U15_003242 [Claviceps sp. LM218 group G6]KAG6097972.1 hypothetical protein E4U30_000159 [Claviceps sp. LM220 group G6]KAG6106593.1 hypothetical protein E4U31_000740 [Claviceps sp. LM219 group G6]KAG6116235.1 hypothetical protein E4U14_000365 [Claviceps sp. LM454 group G7]